MNILLLGGTGNISTACAALLHQRGHRITVLTRGRHPVPCEYESLLGDRKDEQAMQKLLEGRHFDVIGDFTTYTAADAAEMVRLFKGRCGQYLFISTVVVYARPPVRLPITETAPKGNFYSQYGRDKEAAEAVFMDAFRRDGFPVTIIRPSHTYSEQWIPNIVSSTGYTVAKRLEDHRPVFIHNDGQSLWTLTHVRDFAVGFAGLAGLSAAVGEDFQITADAPLTWNQIYEEIRLACGVDHMELLHIPMDFILERAPSLVAKLPGDKAWNAVFDCAKIKRFVPDFQCRIPFREGIRESVAWFRQVPERQMPDPKIDAIFDQVTSAWLSR